MPKSTMEEKPSKIMNERCGVKEYESDSDEEEFKLNSFAHIYSKNTVRELLEADTVIGNYCSVDFVN